MAQATPHRPARERVTGRFGELRLNGISRAYGAHVALHPLDLTVRGGEFIALLGPSGCGKTTALNSIAGLLPLTAGSIELDGRRIDTLPPEKRGFGMVFQNYALFPHLTVRANVAFGLKMRKLPKAEVDRRVDETLRLVRLTGHAHKHPGQLSGGQQQRVAIARAIVLEPPLVLMDEPLSNLDAALRLDMRAEIRRIHQEFGLTTLYVTHDQEEALSLADRLVVLDAGHVAQIGTPAELYEAPASAYVAAFMGYRNILNLTAGTVGTEGVRAGGRGISLLGKPAAGTRIEPGTQVQIAIRPEDVTIVGEAAQGGGATAADAAAASETFDAVAEIVEYHGRGFHVDALTPAGDRIHLRTQSRVAPGDPLRLTAAPERVLVFPGADE
ncbi:MAG TPA: ABC transporter ATP-binding protein [Actinocrinis sp.]|uniref:ABC transporter ATP-binding protein n=1 Tax=Actinocrinis sp. TaxID=1920516 RepID=UPI002DED76B3|nr:ABC transporter ATP-binding protein [Actinocrinis sp.]